MEERVLRATQDLLADEGYHRMSLDQVVAASGVSKPTLYRRWPTKAALAAAAVAKLHSDRPAEDASTDVRTQLIDELEDLRSTYDRLHGMAMVGTLLAEERHHPELIEVWRELVARPRRQRMLDVLVAAREGGQLSDGADVVTAVRLLVGSYYAHHTAGEPFAPDWARRAVDLVWAGLTR